MSNSLYSFGKTLFLSGGIDLLTDDIKAVLVDNSYSPDIELDQYYSSVSGFAITTPFSLTGKSVTGGVFLSDPVTFSGVMGNAYFVVLFKDTGAAMTSPLVCLFDSIPGFPISSSGDDIIIDWDSGSNKVFKI